MSWTERIRRKAVEATVGWTVEKLLTAIGSLLAAIISPFLLRYVPWVGEALKARVAIPVWVLLTVVLVVVAAAGLLARSRPRPAGQPSSVTVTPPPGTDPSGERELERARQELHQTKGELEIVREEIKRLAPPKTPFFYFGYCWELLPYFFRCREIQTPGDGTLDNTVMGPFCPRCARPLKHDAGRGDYAIESPCGTCGYRGQEVEDGFKHGLTFRQLHAAVYREAQRLDRSKQSFPPCPPPSFHGSHS